MAATESPPIRGPVGDLHVTRVDGESVSTRRDRLATEEPLEIRAQGPGQAAVSVAVTMRTPGADFELAAGFLFTEGLITSRDEVDTIRYCDPGPSGDQHYNVLTVRLRRPFDASVLARNFFATSSCGVCGKASIEALEVACAPLPAGPVVRREVIESLPAALRTAQPGFALTGGIHATALFSPEGQLHDAREDVGRHNAMDKLVGAELFAGRLPASEAIALVSGRVSFELVQKAGVAGIPILCAVSAPSTLAVETARRLGMTLVGFLRGRRFNVYTHVERIDVTRR